MITLLINHIIMKKLELFLVFVVLCTTGLTAQNQDNYTVQAQGHFMLINGDVFLVKDIQPMLLQSRITLSDGTIVNPDGTYQTKDLKRYRLHEKECLDNDGIKYRNECQYRNKVIQENKGLTLAKIQERNQHRFQIKLLDGKVFKIKNQSQNRLMKRTELTNGTIVYPDGHFKSPNRNKLSQLLEGECLNMDGKMFHNTCIHQQHLIEKEI